MERLIAAVFIQGIAVAPLILIARPLEKRWKHLLLFFAFYVLYVFLLALPNYYTGLKMVAGDWNWSGKIYATTGSLLFYFLCRKAFSEIDFITFKQNSASTRWKLMATMLVFVVAVGLAFFSKNNSAARSEYFLFQFTMPGLDEELAFRGVMLGLLSNALPSKLYVGAKNLGHPALLITSVLFGLLHSLSIDQQWGFHHNWFEFFNAFFVGCLLAWITLRTGSIVMPVLVHNLINTLPKIIFGM